MMRRALSISLAFLLALLAAGPAAGQSRRTLEDNQIIVDLSVNYRYSYRDGTWVPLDVAVANNAFDVDGYIEVRCYQFDELQSPIYRVPAVSPKASLKRFRLHCFLKGTTQVEAMLYHKGRPALDVPQPLVLNPIRAEDLMALVLDEQPTDYGFMSVAVQDEEAGRRYYREEVRADRLDYLADYPQCYDPYDVIVFGKMDPEAIPPWRRSCIERYVRRGGTLVVMTGEHAVPYRGTWIEELAGVSIGLGEALNEATLMERALAPERRSQARSDRDGVFVKLTPREAGMMYWGDEGEILAAMRRVGRGRVITFAIDAASHALQDNPAYLELWRALSFYKERSGELNYGAGAIVCQEEMPRLTNVELFSKASVMLYLGLYFAVGIVGNWLVCSWLKRREWAWVVLVVCSIGFTGYALVFGTAGRARESEILQAEVLRVPQGGGVADLNAAIGILAKGTTRLSIGLKQDFAVAQDLTTVVPWQQVGYRLPGRADPFTFVESVPGRMERFRVGASELRLIETQAQVSMPGGIEGKLKYEPGGNLSGTLINKTGMKLDYGFVLFDGQVYPAKRTAVGFEVSEGAVPYVYDQLGQYAFPVQGLIQPGRVGPSQSSAFFARYLISLLRQGGAEDVIDTDIGPALIAWAENERVGTLVFDEEIRESVGATLVVADIDVEGIEGTQKRWVNLAYRGPGSEEWKEPRPGEVFDPSARGFEMGGSVSVPIEIRVPPEVIESPGAELWLDVAWERYYGFDHQITCPDENTRVIQVRSIRPGGPRGAYVGHTYRLDNWRDGAAANGIVRCDLSVTTTPQRASGQWISFFARARIREDISQQGGWQAWPLSRP